MLHFRHLLFLSIKSLCRANKITAKHLVPILSILLKHINPCNKTGITSPRDITLQPHVPINCRLFPKSDPVDSNGQVVGIRSLCVRLANISLKRVHHLEELANSDGVVVQLLELICQRWWGAEWEFKAEVRTERGVSRDVRGVFVRFYVAFMHIVVYILHTCTVFQEFFWFVVIEQLVAWGMHHSALECKYEGLPHYLKPSRRNISHYF